MADAHKLDPMHSREFADWLEDRDSVVTLGVDNFGAKVFAGKPGGTEGYTLWWNDYVINEWAEWYPDLGTALARFAALFRADDISRVAELFEGLEGYGYFRTEDPAEFMRWSDQFFERTITGTINPGTRRAQ